MARRKSYFEAVRKGGASVLALDAGNALFADPVRSDADAKKRAELLVRTMGQLGVAAMAVGERDLTAGPEYVKTLAGKHGVEPLSVNLTRDGKPVFAPSKVVEVGGANGPVKVGVIGASPAGKRPQGLVGAPVTAAVVAEAKKLRAKKVDLVVVLAAVPYADALKLAGDAGAAVDLVLQSHDQRGIGPGVPIPGKGNYLVHTGERGRQIARVDLVLKGPGALTDATAEERQRKSLEILDRQITATQQRIASAPDAKMKASYEATLAGFRERRAQVERSLAANAGGENRVFRLSYTTLGPDMPSDPALAQQVARLNPHAGHGH